ncbi:MAG: cbb3-type cytochrome oxidase assembly protein CcoS [Gammaproteobacteria bacterium]
MDILYLLIPLSVLLVFLAAAVFWYALASGQFDDLEGPAHRILMDDEGPAASKPQDPPSSGADDGQRS